MATGQPWLQDPVDLVQEDLGVAGADEESRRLQKRSTKSARRAREDVVVDDRHDVTGGQAARRRGCWASRRRNWNWRSNGISSLVAGIELLLIAE